MSGRIIHFKIAHEDTIFMLKDAFRTQSIIYDGTFCEKKYNSIQRIFA